MAKKDRYLVGLDVGSTKTCALIGGNRRTSRCEISGAGRGGIQGLRKGQIVNLDSTVSSIRRAVEEAEGVANVPVESARDRRSRRPRARRQQPRRNHLGHARRAISSATMYAAPSKPRAEHYLPEDREVLHVLPQEFLRRRAGQHPRRHRHGRPAPGSQRPPRHLLRGRHAKYGHRRESRAFW